MKFFDLLSSDRKFYLLDHDQHFFGVGGLTNHRQMSNNCSQGHFTLNAFRIRETACSTIRELSSNSKELSKKTPFVFPDQKQKGEIDETGSLYRVAGDIGANHILRNFFARLVVFSSSASISSRPLSQNDLSAMFIPRLPKIFFGESDRPADRKSFTL